MSKTWQADSNWGESVSKVKSSLTKSNCKSARPNQICIPRVVRPTAKHQLKRMAPIKESVPVASFRTKMMKGRHSNRQPHTEKLTDLWIPIQITPSYAATKFKLFTDDAIHSNDKRRGRPRTRALVMCGNCTKRSKPVYKWPSLHFQLDCPLSRLKANQHD